MTLHDDYQYYCCCDVTDDHVDGGGSQTIEHHDVELVAHLILQPTNNSKNAKNMMNAVFGLYIDFWFWFLVWFLYGFTFVL